MQFKHLKKPFQNSWRPSTISLGRFIKFSLLLILFSYNEVNANGLSNPIEVQGKVISQKGEPVQYASILIKGGKTVTATNSAGLFTISVPKGSTTELLVSGVGFKSKIVQVNKQTDLYIILENDSTKHKAEVAIGYGTENKNKITGAVSSISAKRLVDNTIINLGQALQNKVAGVQVISQGAGVPGQNPLIRIRGTNSITAGNDPLYVVDGVLGFENPLAILNPNDIHSVEILKDASATGVYGVRGANGVILVTTKRGQTGKLQININKSTSVNTLQRHVYALNAEQFSYLYMQTMYNAKKFGNIIPGNDFRATAQGGEGNQGTNTFSSMGHLFKLVPEGQKFSVPLFGANGKSYMPIYNTNWEDEIFNNSISQNDHISISGGTENAKFFASVGVTDEQGLMASSFYKRFTSKIVGDIKASKWLSFSASMMFNKSQATGDDGITRSAFEVWPILPVQYPNDSVSGTYAGRWSSNFDFKIGEQWWNVLFRRDQIYQRNHVSQLVGSFSAEALISKDLSFKSDFSINSSNYKNNGYSGQLYGGTGSASVNVTNSYYWQNENYFNYKKRFTQNHIINAMLGFSWSRRSFETLGASNSIFLSNFYGYSNLGAGAAARPGASSGDGNNALNSYFARINYAFKDRYMLTLTGREDGSSRFGANNKYGFFPTVGTAWDVKQEQFLKNVNLISNLKVRASIGKTGNQEIGNYQSQAFISTTSILQYGAVQTGLVSASTPNPDLKWETTVQKDLGFEVGFLNNRINVEVDLYDKLTSDIPINVSLPLSTTTGSVLLNYAKVQNRGLELTLNTLNFATPNIKWNTSITMTANRNKVKQLGPTNAPIYQQFGTGNATTIIKVGEPIGSFFGLKRLGTWSTMEQSAALQYGRIPGDLKFFDANEDGRIDFSTDGMIIGKGFPDWVVGILNTVTVKRFDFILDLQIVQGIQKARINETGEDRQLASGNFNSVLKAWRPDAQNTMVAQLRPGNGGAIYNYQSFSDSHSITDASFIRGSNATIGYTLSDKLAKRIKCQNLRVYVNAKNFFLLTKAQGYDPEGSSLDKNLSLAPNTDKYQYPTPSVYTIGLNISL
jgi:TonB-linked SusC/RagA family outer membrane protein